MALLKCKLCGGDLNVLPGDTVCECEYCGSRQTVPRVDDEKKVALFTRANRLRAMCDFDKAYGVYESIVAQFPEEAEAYWGLILCRYGIEYVDDPATGRKVPTCHRSSYESVMEDADLDLVMEYSDPVARGVYREEAKAIERLRLAIMEVSAREAPYDIFICYKEKDEQGERTLDSVLAQDVYTALTGKGYRVFFARISLEDRLGQDYEPCIFAALHSAKVMLVFATDYEYVNAPWVRNEWSRFLSLMAKGEDKTLIPCYKNLDAYDLPKEFGRLQAQDLGKVGAMQDLLRGIDKIFGRTETQSAAPAQTGAPSPAQALIRRAELFLEEKNWQKALEYCDQALDSSPESGKAYLVKELAQRQCTEISELAALYHDGVKESQTLAYARRFADPETKKALDEMDDTIARWDELQNAKRHGPEAMKKRAAIDKAREEMKLLEGRVAVSDDFTLGLMQDGSVVCTPLKEGRIRKEDGRLDALNWKRMLSILPDPGMMDFLVGICADGSIRVSGDEYGAVPEDVPAEELSHWRDIRQVYTSLYGWYGLTGSGEVLFAPRADGKYKNTDDHGARNVSDLKGIRKIFTDYRDRLYCIQRDGRIVSTEYLNGKDEDSRWAEVSQWTEIADAIRGAAPGRWIGIRKDGTLVATKYEEDPYYDSGEETDKWADMSGWTDVVSLTHTVNRVIALDAFGDLHATTPFDPENDPKRGLWQKVSKWDGLVAFFADVNEDYFIGLRYDGTVLSAKQFTDPKHDKGQADVAGWKNIARIETGDSCTVGIGRDGRVYRAGEDNNCGCNETQDMKLFDDPDSLKKALEADAEQARREQERRAAYEKLVRERAEAIAPQLAARREEIRAACAAQRKALMGEQRGKLQELTGRLELLRKRKRDAEARRASLGLFKGREKKGLADQIDEIGRQLSRMPSAESLEQAYRQKLTALDERESTLMTEAEKEINAAHPLPSFEEFQP